MLVNFSTAVLFRFQTSAHGPFGLLIRSAGYLNLRRSLTPTRLRGKREAESWNTGHLGGTLPGQLAQAAPADALTAVRSFSGGFFAAWFSKAIASSAASQARQIG